MYIGIIMPNGKHHCTLTFNGREETEDQYKGAVLALASAARAWKAGPFDLEFDGTVRFQPSGAYVAKVKSKTLLKFRKELLIWLDAVGGVPYSTEFDFKPHITLTYYPRNVKNPYEGLTIPVTHISVFSDEFGETKVRV